MQGWIDKTSMVFGVIMLTLLPTCLFAQQNSQYNTKAGCMMCHQMTTAAKIETIKKDLHTVKSKKK